MKTRITRLTIQGFKSFRKKVSIPIFPGFNVFCGPNGVGKSNIVDAISFVIGSTSTKAMRAGRLHELIYHGNKNIPPSEYASVTLWLDNSDNLFNIDAPEISIKRKVNKKGIGTYKINGKTTTREKVLELLSSARIYPDGFNIIMQGDVTQIIEMNPQERREIIDEISGISHYNEKKEKAQRDLDKVAEKLKEVEIILTERLERLQQLEADRNAALRFKELTARLEKLEASLAHKKFTTEQEKFKSTEQEIENSEKKITELEQEINKLEKEIEDTEKRREGIIEEIFMKSKEAGIREDIEEIKNKIIRNKDKIESNEREIERLNNIIEKLKSISDTGFSLRKAVKEILGLKKSGIFGTLKDIIKVPKDYEIAVDSSAGSRLQNLVVDSPQTAISCINFLKNEKLGRATFLPLSRIRKRELTIDQKRLLKRPGVVGLLSDLIKYDTKYDSAVKYIFGDTIVVENLGVARDIGIGKVRMVTVDGDLAEKSGAMIGGFYTKKSTFSSAEIDSYEQSKKDLEEEINFLRIEIGQLNKKLDELREKEQDSGTRTLDLEKQRKKIDEELEQMKVKRNELFEERLKLQSRINRLKIKSAKTEAEMENWKIEVEKYKEIEYVDEDPEKMEEEIKVISNTLSSFGLVNMKAIDEYDAFKVEFDKLKSKYDKISEEKKSIENMMNKIEEKRRDVFYTCLRGINKNFKEIFREMTNGTASIELENPVDIESGLMIKASPGGKTLLNIDAMSGGEKTLTALAFLFAVQKYKPAPFYILDEIDAALDKVNSKKIAKMLKKLSENEQFIVITHNDYTIKQGNRVYGLSLENGESKILGLELPEIKVN